MKVFSFLSKNIPERNNRNAPSIDFNVRIAAFLFAGNRADYYQYLADMIEGTKGRMSLRDIFASDARRYGKTSRGILSEHWTRQFEEGGSLTRAFAGTLPKEDVGVLTILQESGGEGVLEGGLRDMASNTGLVSQAKGVFIKTMTASLVCVLATMVLVIAMPAYTVPMLAEAFGMLPPEYYPDNVKALFSFADFVTASWGKLLIAVAAIVGGLMWSLSNVTGKTREYLDRYGVAWGLYRDFQSVRFICHLASMVKRRGNTTRALRDAVAMQLTGASRWKRYHLTKMLNLIDSGVVGAPIFKTGIMDKETAWYLEDLIASRGIEDALGFIRTRIETRIIERITAQSALFSWVVMLVSIGVGGYLMFWHIAAIDDMRGALQQFLS